MRVVVSWYRGPRSRKVRTGRVFPKKGCFLVVRTKTWAEEFVYSIRDGLVLFSRYPSYLSELGPKIRYPYPRRTVKKRQAAVSETSGGPVHLAAVETELFAKHPNIVAHLVTTRFEDGSPRTPGIIIVGSMGTAHTLTAKEPDAGLQLRVSATTIDDCWASLDLLLGTPDAPWEIDRWAQGRNQKKK